MTKKRPIMWDILDDINFKKVDLSRKDSNILNNYNPYSINLALSSNVDVLPYVDIMNKYPDIDKQMHYDYLLHGLSKRKRMNKIIRVENTDDMKMLQNYYNINRALSEEYMNLLSKEQLNKIRQLTDVGGK